MMWHRVAVAFAFVVGSAVAAAGQASRAEQVGAQALRDGDADRAAAVFAEGLQQYPANPNLHFGAGVAAHLRGRDSEARAALEKALQLEPEFIGAAALYGELAYQHGDVDVAIQTYERALAYAPMNQNLASRLAVWRAEASKELRLDGRFSIAFDGPAESRLAAHATQALQSSYWRLGKALGAYPSDSIAVVFYTREDFTIRDRRAGVGGRRVRHAHPDAGARRAGRAGAVRSDSHPRAGACDDRRPRQARYPGVAARRAGVLPRARRR
jgi:tetratricopeptide (TPR) repeat protein